MNAAGDRQLENQREISKIKRRLDAERLGGVAHKVQVGFARLLAETPIRREWYAEVWRDWRKAAEDAEPAALAALKKYLDAREDFRVFVEDLSPIGFDDSVTFASAITGIFDAAIRTLKSSEAAARVLAKRTPRRPAAVEQEPKPKPVKWWEYLFWLFIKNKRLAAWEAATAAAAAATVPEPPRIPATIAEALTTGAIDTAALTSEGLECVRMTLEERLAQTVARHHSATRVMSQRKAFWDADALEAFKNCKVPPAPKPVKWWESLLWLFIKQRRLAAWEVAKAAAVWKDPPLPIVPANRELWPQLFSFRAECEEDATTLAISICQRVPPMPKPVKWWERLLWPFIKKRRLEAWEADTALAASQGGVFRPVDSAIEKCALLADGARQAAKLPEKVTISGVSDFLALCERGAQVLKELREITSTMEAALRS